MPQNSFPPPSSSSSSERRESRIRGEKGGGLRGRREEEKGGGGKGHLRIVSTESRFVPGKMAARETPHSLLHNSPDKATRGLR